MKVGGKRKQSIKLSVASISRFLRLQSWNMKVKIHVILVALLLAKTCPAQQTTSTPVGRGQHSACFDRTTGTMLVFGGAPHGSSAVKPTVNNSLWGWSEKGWKILSQGGPSQREDAKMVFHDVNKAAYLYGGRTYDTLGKPVVMDDFWQWDGSSWKLLSEHSAPGKRLHSNMAYDRSRNTIVMFGGAMFEGGFTNDVWEWDGNEWKKIEFSNGPAPRLAHTQIYSTALKRVVIIGGVSDKGETLRDMWAWNGKEFEFLGNNCPSIEVGQGNAVCMDKKRRVKILLVGRPTSLADLKNTQHQMYVNGSWLWDGRNWIKVASVANPPLREFHTLVYDNENKQAILFGGSGREESGFSSPNDIWLFKNGAWKTYAYAE